MAGVALGDIDRRFAWQAWHLWHWAGSGGALGSPVGAVDAAPVCVAGVALADIDPHLRGRRGTWRHRPSLCVASVALGDIDRHFAGQAWHLWHWAGSGGALPSPVGALDAAPVCVAGVALDDIDRHFAWQAWHLATSILTLRGMHGTWRHRPSLCVAGVALMALGWLWWHAWISSLLRGRRPCLRGRRGTWRYRPSLCVAGVALGDIDHHYTIFHTPCLTHHLSHHFVTQHLSHHFFTHLLRNVLSNC